MKKIASLDALRGYAILLVIFIHMPAIGNNIVGKLIHTVAYHTNSGYLGVQIFFVLSGFLISRILIKEKRNNETSFKRFYLKRSLRIFPIYYLSIIVFGILISWKYVIPVCLYISNYWFAFNHYDGPWLITWSLAVEEHFYLFWPLLIYKLSINESKLIIKYIVPSVILFLAIITVFTTNHPLASVLMIRATHFQILSLCLGSYLAYIENRLYKIKTKYILMMIFTFVLLLFIAVTSNHIASTHYVTSTHLFLQTISPIFVLLTFSLCGVIALIVFLNIPYDKLSGKLIINKPIRFVGKISYGIYLYHYPILYLLKITYPQIHGSYSIPAKVGIEALLLIFMVAIVSYYLIERPLLVFKDRLSNKWFAKQKVHAPLVN